MNPAQSLESLRAQERRGTLNPVAAELLDRLEPGWRLADRERQWRLNLARYGLFLRREGRPPSLNGGLAEQALARWVRRQRDAHADQTLDSDRRKLLDRVPGHRW